VILKALLFWGLLLSLLGWNVRSKGKKSKAWCDFSRNMSCTKALTSEYASLLPPSNPVVGALYYVVMLLLLQQAMMAILSWLAALAVIGSIYLAYVSFVKQKNYCLLCIGVYLVNIAVYVLLVS